MTVTSVATETNNHRQIPTPASIMRLKETMKKIKMTDKQFQKHRKQRMVAMEKFIKEIKSGHIKSEVPF